jgi:hypothetical protein
MYTEHLYINLTAGAMSTFRNGMRVVEAQQQPSGDWLVVEGRRTYVLEDEVFRRRWEPVDEGARRMWRNGTNPMAVETAGPGGISGSSPLQNRG